MLGTGGCVSTQACRGFSGTGRPRSRRRIERQVKILVTGPTGTSSTANDRTLPGGRLWFTDSGDWNPADRIGTAHASDRRDRAHRRGTQYVYERHRRRADRSIVWVDPTRSRHPPDGRRPEVSDPHLPGAHPGRAEDRRRRQFLDHRRRRRRVDIADRNGKPLDFLESGGTILNCCFGKGGALYLCDMGPSA
jgi:sugar lactone lactonase YvrE